MRLRNRRVQDPAALENFEQIEGSLTALSLALGDVKIRFGSATMNYVGGSGTKTVAHGLGRAPIWVHAIGNTMGGGDTNRSYYSVDGWNTNDIVFRGHTPTAGVAGGIQFYWIAVGPT